MSARLATAAVLLAGVSLSCGGNRETNNLTSPLAGATGVEAGDGALSTSATKQTICHVEAETGLIQNLSLPARAVQAHLAHGDTLGECVPCPCYTTEMILSTATDTDLCSSLNVASQYSATSDPATLLVTCHGPSVQLLGAYSSSTSNGGRCDRFDTKFGPKTASPLTAAQHAACNAAIQATRPQLQ